MYFCSAPGPVRRTERKSCRTGARPAGNNENRAMNTGATPAPLRPEPGRSAASAGGPSPIYYTARPSNNCTVSVTMLNFPRDSVSVCCILRYVCPSPRLFASVRSETKRESSPSGRLSGRLCPSLCDTDALYWPV